MPADNGPVRTTDSGRGRLEVYWPWDEVLVYGPTGDCILHLEVMDAGHRLNDRRRKKTRNCGFAHLLAFPETSVDLPLEHKS